jgi:hypothetical protein
MRWWICSLLLTSACFRVEGLDLGAFNPDGSVPPPPISHVPVRYLTDGTCDLIISTSRTFDTQTGQLDAAPLPSGCLHNIETTPGGDGGQPSSISVLAVRSLMIAAGSTLKVTGPNPLVIAAGTTIEINGIIDGSANLNTQGPGGLATGPGVGGNGNSAGTNLIVDSGGAGGSFGTNGADGADADNGTTTAPGGPRGMQYPIIDPSLSTALLAGSTGGAGIGPVTNSDPTIACGLGGGGGGAIQLTAGTSLQIGAAGRLLVNGGGGLGGCADSSSNPARSGGGGGSGGALFLEAPILTIDNGAVLTANGGGGGGGADTGDKRGNNGQNGSASDNPALGGATVGSGPNNPSGTGGNGAAGTILPTSGSVTANTGGGGAGLGRTVFRAQTQPTSPAIISPAATFVAF